MYNYYEFVILLFHETLHSFMMNTVIAYRGFVRLSYRYWLLFPCEGQQFCFSFLFARRKPFFFFFSFNQVKSLLQMTFHRVLNTRITVAYEQCLKVRNFSLQHVYVSKYCNRLLTDLRVLFTRTFCFSFRVSCIRSSNS